MDLAIGVVPIDGDANVFSSCPVGSDLVAHLQCLLEVICMLFTGVFDSEVVYHKRELDGSSRVLP